jgi:peptidoglycan/xylan/chitin deacetylase (PgdA/CDA1 family)
LALASRGPVEVALTVDDLPVHGPVQAGVERVALAERFVAAFKRHRLPPVHGFVNGARVAEHPGAEKVLTLWVQSGNHLGNHTDSHVSLNDVGLPAYFADIERGETVLDAFDPAWRSSKTFRYPFLFEGNSREKRDGVRDYLRARGYEIAEVTVEADDWAFNQPFFRCANQGNAEALKHLHQRFVEAHVDELERMRELTRRLAGREIRHVLLLHLGVADADALDDLLTAYEHAGVRFVSLQEALSDPFYDLDPGVPFPFGAAFPYLVAKARGVHAAAPIYARGLEQDLARACR